MNPISSRRRFILGALSGAGALVLSGCDKLASAAWFQKTLGAGESLTHVAQRWVIPRKAMAQEFSDADLSPQFRSNGTAVPRNAQYQALAMGGFAAYRLEVGGLVERPASLSLADLLRAAEPNADNAARLCRGWSAIGSGRARSLPRCSRSSSRKPRRYVVFHCADLMENDGTSPYYESIDFEDAYHPQTILA
jgi:DMSO/TMAO reductase YedYZ molybdopterin-dependent catalytic subunit